MLDEITHTHDGPDPRAPRPDHDDTVTYHRRRETAGWSEERLATLVTRDSIIGVTTLSV